MKRGSHILCSKRIDTKQEQVRKHGITEAHIQPELTFDPEMPKNSKT